MHGCKCTYSADAYTGTVQGFRIYVDGVYRASLQAPQDYFQVGCLFWHHPCRPCTHIKHNRHLFLASLREGADERCMLQPPERSQQAAPVACLVGCKRCWRNEMGC